MKLKDVPDEEFVLPGTSGCIGCGANLALRLASKTLGSNTIMVNATGCMSVNVMYGATKFAFYHVAFENAASVASGIDVALRKLQKRRGINLVCFAGDGGTADIGLQALSGAAERGHRFTYICYDNESYMNTGGQRSGTTPWGASTKVTPSGKFWEKLQRTSHSRKNLPKIMWAHGVPYIATCSVAFPMDYLAKLKKALAVDGLSYIHVHAPCPPGWGYPEHLTIRVARLAVQTGMFMLYEIANGKLNLTRKIARRKLLKEYTELQGRFVHLTKRDANRLARLVEKHWLEVA